MHQPTIKTLSALTLAALPHRGDYRLIGGVFENLARWAGANGAGANGLLGPNMRWIGVYYDDPDQTPTDALRSHACLFTPDGAAVAAVKPPLEIVQLAAGRHAVVLHRGPYAELADVYRKLYRTWLPNSGETASGAPPHEEYLNDCRTLPPTEWLTEIRLPLAANGDDVT